MCAKTRERRGKEQERRRGRAASRQTKPKEIKINRDSKLRADGGKNEARRRGEEMRWSRRRRIGRGRKREQERGEGGRRGPR